MVGIARAAESASAGWRAALELVFARRAHQTILMRRRHEGPLRVQRPFYPEGDSACHVYLLHPPGGVVGGDELNIAVDAGPATHCVLTTPAAGKFYRSAGAQAVQRQTLSVAAGAVLEWLPQENIVFDAANVALTTRVQLDADAMFAGWEIVCLGRAAAGEGFAHGRLQTRLQLWRGEHPLLVERLLLGADTGTLQGPWGLARHSVTGTFVVTGDYGANLAELRALLPQRTEQGLCAVTQLSGVFVCRYLGDDSEAARRCFETVWKLLRPRYAGAAAVRPRIWDT